MYAVSPAFVASCSVHLSIQFDVHNPVDTVSSSLSLFVALFGVFCHLLLSIPPKFVFYSDILSVAQAAPTS